MNNVAGIDSLWEQLCTDFPPENSVDLCTRKRHLNDVLPVFGILFLHKSYRPYYMVLSVMMKVKKYKYLCISFPTLSFTDTPPTFVNCFFSESKIVKMVGACKINQYSKVNICMTVTILHGF